MHHLLDTMNEQQREAVLCTEGPLLVLAGAGSGKTRVLTHRIAYLIQEKGVNPWNIMAITFTNKAAQEMKDRADALVGMGSEALWVSTFHSSCARILRRYIDRIGYSSNFTIYDTDDTKSLMKDIIRTLDLDPKLYKEKNLLSKISAAKNNFVRAEEYQRSVTSWQERKIAEIYMEYQARLKKNNALDFDDLLVKTVELFQTCPDVLDYYQNRFQYIMVDEYQDTNTVQFEFISALAKRNRNLCVVGDDDQSIYKFRGANIENILGFERVFPDAKVIKLEQNYRSTGSILDAANNVIGNNIGRKAKRLWTENGEGEKVRFRQFQNGYEEAEFIAGDISDRVREGASYNQFAILYRTNAQSRLFEEKFMMANIPYKLVGGINFYARREIKDLLAYLKTVDNGQDDLAVQRIINVPKRGIGAATIARVDQYAYEQGIHFYDALLEAEYIPGIGRSLGKLRSFTTFIQSLRSVDGYLSVTELLKRIIEETGYVKALETEDTDESRARIENIDELISKTADYEESAEQPTLSGFLQEVALVADIDSVEEEKDYVLMMTFHSAKGLEFDQVYMAGMEDGLFPSYMTLTADNTDDLEEERRLCYVGITRARKLLTLTAAQMRMVRGETQYNKTSRFVREIPRELVDLGRDVEVQRKFNKPETMFGGLGAGGSNGSGAKRVYPSSVFKPREFTVKKADSLDYKVGDTVRHMKFGVGVVQAIADGGKDYEVTVQFENAGVKRMFASFAKLKKV
ncbi:MAG: DNA helicase PcrA [Lachnospiraceae bacterium]|nr:DNA helicase PcrA [Lachnospiraceae bacterium]